MKLCLVEGCGRLTAQRGKRFCGMHESRYRRSGDPTKLLGHRPYRWQDILAAGGYRLVIEPIELPENEWPIGAVRAEVHGKTIHYLYA